MLIAEEGNDGSVAGTTDATNAYMDAMHADPRFSNMTIKVELAYGHAFKKLKVSPREELLTLRLGEEDINPREVTGNYLEPDEFYEAMQDENTVVSDARNDY